MLIQIDKKKQRVWSLDASSSSRKVPCNVVGICMNLLIILSLDATAFNCCQCFVKWMCGFCL